MKPDVHFGYESEIIINDHNCELCSCSYLFQKFEDKVEFNANQVS